MTSSARQIVLRDAVTGDCAELAQLINLAGEGLPYYFWQQTAGRGEDPWQVGQARAARDTGGFSYRNSVIAEIDGKIAGALIGYAVADEPEPIDINDTPPMFVPLAELENLAAGTWYINTVAAFPEFRGLGVGSALMRRGEEIAANLGLRGTSLIVSDANLGARRLYERLGYEEIASRPMVKDGWENDGENWVLMIR